MDQVAEKYLRRGLKLLRAAEGDALAIAKILDEVHKNIIEALGKGYESAKTMRDIKKLDKIIEKELENFYSNDLAREFSEISSTVIASEVAWNAKALIGFISDKKTNILTPVFKQAVESAASKKYNGKTFDTWLTQSFGSNTRKISEQLKKSFINSESLSEVIPKIKLLNKGQVSDIKALSRSFFMHNAVEAKENVFSLNPNVVLGTIWNSTLDARTTPLICGVRDQMRYDLKNNPINHSLPWIDGPGRAHFCCRSIGTPIIKGVNEPSQRPAIGAGDNYESGDNETRNGTVRKPNKSTIEKGIFKVTEVTTKTNYESFLKAQASKNIDYVSDILGSKKDAILFRDGKISLFELAKDSPVSTPTNRKAI